MLGTSRSLNGPDSCLHLHLMSPQVWVGVQKYVPDTVPHPISHPVGVRGSYSQPERLTRVRSQSWGPVGLKGFWFQSVDI